MKLSSLCVPLLRQSEQGNIIMLTSIAARTGSPTATLYGASKGALDTFTRGLAKELAPDIRVNAIAPGIIETHFHDNITSSDKMAQWQEATPLKQNGKAIDVAKATRFIIDNDFMTGETIDINGGLLMR
jgi:3-oxoacyl-[acyl-carrier protein] reductase